MTTQGEELRAGARRAGRAGGAPDDFEAVLERPRDPSFGDWATNAAMVLAKPLRQKPRQIADSLVAALDLKRAGLTAAETAGPGFINFRVRTGSIAKGLAALAAPGRALGKGSSGAGKPVNVEFVSAN